MKRILSVLMVFVLLLLQSTIVSASEVNGENHIVQTVNDEAENPYISVILPTESTEQNNTSINDTEVLPSTASGSAVTIPDIIASDIVSGSAIETFVPEICVKFPTTLDFTVDPLNILERGQIFSQEFLFENNSNVDLIITFETIYYEFANEIDFRSLTANYSAEEDKGLKDFYMYLDNVSKLPETEPLLITDKEQKNCLSFLLSKDKDAANNTQIFQLKGSVAPFPDIAWKDGDVHIRLETSIIPVMPNDNQNISAKAVLLDKNPKPVSVNAEADNTSIPDPVKKETDITPAPSPSIVPEEPFDTVESKIPCESVNPLITDDLILPIAKDTAVEPVTSAAININNLTFIHDVQNKHLPDKLLNSPEETTGYEYILYSDDEANNLPPEATKVPTENISVNQENLLAALWNKDNETISAFIVLDQTYIDSLHSQIADNTNEDSLPLLEKDCFDEYMKELIGYPGVWKSRNIIDTYLNFQKQLQHFGITEESKKTMVITLFKDRMEAVCTDFDTIKWDKTDLDKVDLEKSWKLDSRVIVYRFKDNQHNKWYIDGEIPYLIRTDPDQDWKLQYVDTGDHFFGKDDSSVNEGDLIFLFPEFTFLNKDEQNLNEKDLANY